MEAVELAAFGIQLTSQGVKALWESTRTQIDINIGNHHPEIILTSPSRFTRGASFPKAMDNEIRYTSNYARDAQKTIHLEADKTRLQFEGAISYKLTPKNINIKMSNSIYLVLAWKVTILGGAYAHLTLIEHDGADILRSDTLKRYYYQTLRHELRKLGESVNCSWSLDEKIPFLACMTTNDTKYAVLNMIIKEGRHESSEMKPIHIELQEHVEWVRPELRMTQKPGIRFTSSNVLVHVFNNCRDITLISRHYKALKGDVKAYKFYPVTPNGQDQVVIESSKVLFGCVSGYLLYEIVNEEDKNLPLIWGSRIFMAIDVSIIPHQVSKRKAAVKLISVKTHRFEGHEDKDELHTNVLYHFMHTHGQESHWNIEKLGLHLEVYFDREARAKLLVRLSRIEKLPKDIPIFHSYGDFKVPMTNILDHIRREIKFNKSKSRMQFQLVENTTTLGGKVKPLTIERIFPPNDKMVTYQKGMDKKQNQRFVSGGYCLYERTEPADNDQNNHFIYCIMPSEMRRDMPICVLSLLQRKRVAEKETDSRYEYSSSLLYMKLPSQEKVDYIDSEDSDDDDDDNDVDDRILSLDDDTKSKIIQLVNDRNQCFKGKHNSKFFEGRLMDRPIAFSKNCKAHIAVHQSVAPPHLLSVSLQDEFNALERVHKNLPAGSEPRPYSIQFGLKNSFGDMVFKLVGYTANGLPRHEVPGTLEYTSPDATSPSKEVVFDLPHQDRVQTIFLRYRDVKNEDIGFDICTLVRLQGPRDEGNGFERAKQTTIVYYITSKEKYDSAIEARVVTSYWKDDECGKMKKKSQKSMSDQERKSLEYVVNVKHNCISANLLDFSTAIHIQPRKSDSQKRRTSSK